MAKELCELGFKYFVDLTEAAEDRVVISYCVRDSDDSDMHKNASITLTSDDVDLSTIDRADAESRAKAAEDIS